MGHKWHGMFNMLLGDDMGEQKEKEMTSELIEPDTSTTSYTLDRK